MLGRPGAWALAWLALLLATPLAAAWEQPYGNAGRSGGAILPDGPLDVVGSFRLGQDVGVPTIWSLKALETPHGVLAVAYLDDGSCHVVRVEDPAAGRFVRIPLEECVHLALQGYDAARDAVLVCRGAAADQGILQAWDARTLEVRWEVVPTRDLGAGTESAIGVCSGSALDPATRRVVAIFGIYEPAHPPTLGIRNQGLARTDHRVASIDLDTGVVQWVSHAPLQRAVLAGPAQGLNTRVLYGVHGVTLTSTGVVVTARAPCVECRHGSGNVVQSVALWFDGDGTYRGALEAKLGDPAAGDDPTKRNGAGSRYAVAQGPLAVLALGGEVVVINPQVARPVFRAPIVAIQNLAPWVVWPTGAWVGDHIVIGLTNSLSSFDARTFDREWSWSEGLDWYYQDVVVLASGELLLLVGRYDPPASQVVRLDSQEGRVLGKIPLPLAPVLTNDGLWYVEMTALRSGLFVVDDVGQVVVLGQADPALRPRVLVSDAYPRSGEAFSVRALPPPAGPAPAHFLVNWGEGAIDNASVGQEVRHVFLEGGDRQVLVTAVYADGRTATETVTINVDQDAPQPRTLLQRAFAPENENLTFGVLGILLTLLGGVFTVGRARRRRSRLERELATLDRIRAVGERDPEAAARALVAYRENLPVELGRGRIDDGQYGVLELRALRLLKLLRTRVVAPVETKLTPRFARLVESAFEDGVLHEAECRNLLGALALETRLSPPEKEALASFLRACVHEADVRAPSLAP